MVSEVLPASVPGVKTHQKRGKRTERTIGSQRMLDGDYNDRTLTQSSAFCHFLKKPTYCDMVAWVQKHGGGREG